MRRILQVYGASNASVATHMCAIGCSTLGDFRLGILPTERLAWRGAAASMRLAASARSKPPPSIPHVIATPPSSRGAYDDPFTF